MERRAKGLPLDTNPISFAIELRRTFNWADPIAGAMTVDKAGLPHVLSQALGTGSA